MNIKTFGPKDPLPDGLLYPKQTHSANIIEVITGDEDLHDADGLWTKINANNASNRAIPANFILGVTTADCAPIAMWNDTHYGIIHAGWRGLCNGIIEKMLKLFNANNKTMPTISDGIAGTTHCSLNIWVGPILETFEIQKDFCYEQLSEAVGTKFFSPLIKGDGSRSDSEGLIFNFRAALASKLPTHTQWDGRDTSKTPELASWRRDKTLENNRNITAIWP